MKEEFSTFDIIKALGIPRERLREWMKRGYVTPRREARGQGDRAVFSREDVYFVSLFKKLIEIGFARNLAGEVVKGFVNRERVLGVRLRHKVKFETIVLRVEGDNVSALTFSPGQKMKLDLGNGDIEILPGGDSLGAKIKEWGGGWDYFHIVNYRKLEQDTDKLLAVLG